MSKKSWTDRFFRRNDDEERYEEDASFKMPLEDIIEKIENHEIKVLTDNYYLQPDDFLEKDDKGKTLLDYVSEYGVLLSDKLESRLLSDTRIIKECLKHKESILLKKKGSVYILSTNIKDDLLFKKIGEETLLEYIIKNNMASYFTINRINDIRVFEAIKKYNKYKAVIYLNKELLFSEYEKGITLFEYLIKSNLIGYDIFRYLEDKRVIETCIKYNKLYLFKHAKSNILLQSLDGKKGTTILEYLIRGNNADKTTFDNLGSNKFLAIDMILRNKAYRYLVYVPNMLFDKARFNPNKTYLDIILDNYNKSVDMYIADIRLDNIPMINRAELYLKCLDKGLVSFLPYITFDSLVEEKNGIKFIDALLELDRDKTINKLLSDKLKKDSRVATLLGLNDVEVKDANVPVVKKDETLRAKNKYLNTKVSKDIERKLSEVTKLLPNCDKSCLEVLISSYKKLANNDYAYAGRELDLLIDYLKQNKKLDIQWTKRKSYFDFDGNIIYIQNSSITTFNHEFGHFLHKAGSYRAKPKNIDYIISDIVDNKNTLVRINQFANTFKDIENKALAEAQRIYDRDYSNYFNKDRYTKIEKLIGEDKREKFSEFKKLGYKLEDIDNVIDNIYSCSRDEYVSRFKKVKIEEIKTNILFEKYSTICALSDMIDAIYKGKMKDKLCKTKEGKTIELPIGHGINYYNGEYGVVDELIADYSQIIKDENGGEVIDYLRYLVGDELVSTLDNFYKKEVIDYRDMDFDMSEAIDYGR